MIVDKNVAGYINSLEGELPSHLKELAQIAHKEEVPIIKKETGTLLRFLLTLLKPKRILEIGSGTGFSAIFMSEYMSEDCTITTIEKVETRLEKARVNLSSCTKSEKITLLEGDALVLLEEMADDIKAEDSLEQAGNRRRDRTIHGRMREYLYELTHMEDLETSIIPVGDGVALTTKK